MGTITRTFANQIKTGGKLDADGLDLTDTFAFTGTVTGAGGGIFESQLLHVRDEKSSNTSGGSSGASTDNIRDLNTVVTNEITGASLSSNQITLPSGTFYIEATAPAYGGALLHRAFLYNTSDSSVTILGSGSYVRSTNAHQTHSFVVGRFTIASSKTFELRHYTSGSQNPGLGVATNDGRTEVYADARIWKVA